MRRTIKGGIAGVILALACCSNSLAQGGDADWDRCLQRPTRACILDEALMRALVVGPAASYQLDKVAEALASAGNIETALRIAHSIPSEQRSRVTALRSIARAQANLGSANEAEQTFTEAHQLADAFEDPLSRAELLQSIAEAEADAGMAIEAAGNFEASLKIAEAVAIHESSECVVFPAPESRLAVLLKALAEQQARAGNMTSALRAARSIKYDEPIHARALQMVAEIQVQHGPQAEAGAVLKEALDAARASQTPSHWPSCPRVVHAAADAVSYVDLLCAVGGAQAVAGLMEDATATLGEALQFVPTIKGGILFEADVFRSLALSQIAAAQSEAGLKPQSAATFERAAQASLEVREAKDRVTALNRLGRAQHEAGHDQEAAGSFEAALALARGLENAVQRATALLNVVDAKVEAGLAADATDTLALVLEATRSMAGKSGRVSQLRRIAQAQDKAGRPQDAAVTYAEALDAVDAATPQGARTNLLFSAIRPWPGEKQDPKLIAESVPQLLRMAQSIDERRRAEVLIVIANALPN
jgi:tetratricopeptide (TPR) repeat protein